MLILVFASTPWTPNAITTYPNERRIKPNAIFIGEEGSMPFLFNLFQNTDTSGTNATIERGLMDWNHEAGIVQLNMVRFVFSSAKSESDAPACSKHAQKKITKK